MTIVEFWPDYDGALLWDESGERVPLAELSLPPDIVARAARWIAEYDDSKLPWEPTRDEAWLAEGRLLFAQLRRELFAGGAGGGPGGRAAAPDALDGLVGHPVPRAQHHDIGSVSLDGELDELDPG